MSAHPVEYVTVPAGLDGDDIVIPAWLAREPHWPRFAFISGRVDFLAGPPDRRFFPLPASAGPSTPDLKGPLMNQAIGAHLQVPTVPGTPFEGGYFAGLFRSNGATWALIVAPKAEGEISGRWIGDAASRSTVDVLGAASCHDGLANTLAMTDGGSALAKALLQFSFNGFDDWYLPSRDELELAYRNLKPTADRNSCSFRDGDNPSSLPAGYPYTPEAPPQTSAAEFAAGGAQAFEPAWYWSSTQYSRSYAWGQYFDDGSQFTGTKSCEGRARAVRRFKVE